MIEHICGWAFTRLVKGVSERNGLILGWAYTRMRLFLTVKIFSVSRKKNIAKAVFDTVPKFCWNTISRFYSILDRTEMI